MFVCVRSSRVCLLLCASSDRVQLASRVSRFLPNFYREGIARFSGNYYIRLCNTAVLNLIPNFPGTGVVIELSRKRFPKHIPAALVPIIER